MSDNTANYKMHILANAKFLYGGDNDYDVISSQKKIQNGASEAIYCKAYLIAYPKHVLAGIPPEGRILRSSGDGKNSGEYTAFRKLHLELRSDVGEIMEDKKVGDTGRGDLMAKEQQEMKNKEELVKW